MSDINFSALEVSDEDRLGPFRAFLAEDTESKAWYVIFASDTGLIPYQGVFWQIAASDYLGKEDTTIMSWHYALEDPARDHFQWLTYRWDESPEVGPQGFENYRMSAMKLAQYAEGNPGPITGPMRGVDDEGDDKQTNIGL